VTRGFFWREQLELMHLDHRPDAIALEGACVNYARAVEADLIVRREGIVIDEPVFYQGKRLRGVTRQRKHPAATIATGAWLLFRAFAREFGLTPLSRTRLAVAPPGRGRRPERITYRASPDRDRARQA
jgi:P27 family predicted phage terminase small subunit